VGGGASKHINSELSEPRELSCKRNQSVVDLQQ
jgi:hypothetical protein